MTAKIVAALAAAASTLALAGCSSAPPVSNDVFCSAMADWGNAMIDIEASTNSLGGLLDGSASPTDATAVGNMHQYAADILAKAADIKGFADTAAANVSDPAVAKAIRDYDKATIDIAVVMAGEAKDAPDLTAFVTAFFAQSAVFQSAGSYDLTGIQKIITDYGTPLCPDPSNPIFGGGTGNLEDSAAKADVSTLGKEIATYYVDWTQGDPDPTITVAGGKYLLNAIPVADVSPNVTVSDQYYNGPTDWCVEVTDSLGTLKTFTYSAVNGLEQGTCS